MLWSSFICFWKYRKGPELFAHPVLLTFVSLTRCCLLARAFSWWFYFSSPIALTPYIQYSSFLDTIKPAGAPACSAGEWGVASLRYPSKSFRLDLVFASVCLFLKFPDHPSCRVFVFLSPVHCHVGLCLFRYISLFSRSFLQHCHCHCISSFSCISQHLSFSRCFP